jgi:hypothetical protein
MALFDYEYLKKELISKDNSKSKMIEDYLKVFGDNPINEEPFYKEYLINFEIIPYRIPLEYKDDYDFDLLGKLICGSFSSKSKFVYLENNLLPDLYIIVDGKNNQVVKKRVEELWSVQLIRCHEIYIEEMMNLQLTLHSYESKDNPLYSERKSNIKKHIQTIENIKTNTRYFDNLVAGKKEINMILNSNSNSKN